MLMCWSVDVTTLYLQLTAALMNGGGLLGLIDLGNVRETNEREVVTLADATPLSLMGYKSNSARQMQSVSYGTDERSLALRRTVQITQLVITGWWAAAALVYTLTHCTLRGSAPYPSRPPRYVSSRLLLTFWWMTRLTVADRMETCGISSSDVWNRLLLLTACRLFAV